MKLLNKITIITLAFSLVAIGSGCSKEDVESNVDKEKEIIEATEECTFADSLGRIINVEKPKRVAAVGNLAKIWQLAGGELSGVTEDEYTSGDLELPESIINLGDSQNISFNDIIDNNIDFVLFSSNVKENVELKESLEAAGVKCAYFHVETFEDYLNTLEIFTKITGKRELFEENGLAIQKQVGEIVDSVKEKPSPKVLLIRTSSTGVLASGSDNMTGTMLKNLGCVNVSDSNEGLLTDLTVDKIAKADPDFIFVVAMGESEDSDLSKLQETLMSDPQWWSLKAVQNENYIVLPQELFRQKPNEMWGESYKTLADMLYGEN